MASDIDSLIAKLEAAPHGSFDLDREIWEYVAGDDASKLDLPPPYSVSIDTAVTLIPEGYCWIIGKGKMRLDEPMYGAQILGGKLGYDEVIAEGENDSSAALALVVASLKARASLKADG